MPHDCGPAPVTVTAATLADKLDDMTLHDETGDPRDEGYRPPYASSATG